MSEDIRQVEEVMNEQEDRHPIWSKIRRVLIFWSILLLFLTGIVLGIGAFIVNGLQHVETNEEVTFVIEPGTHSSIIAEQMEDAGLIRNAFIFKYYLRYKGEGNHFQAGEYLISPGMTIDELIYKFNTGDTVEEEVIRFTVPEGKTIDQIAEILSQTGIADKEQFLALLVDPQLFPNSLAEQIPVEENYKHAMEGYLFPETYEVPLDSTAEDVITRMVQELQRKLETLPADWEQQMDELGITFHELLTIASLIEREVVVDKERQLVAGVIYNRLSSDYPLQIDASVQYALEEPKERLLYEDLEVDSPYNTYKYPGLPPGPIASPGLLSIEAALYPAETDYMFYVTKKDGTAEHYFANTYAEHQANIRKSNQNAENTQ